jgi:hypothetical protein
MKGQPPPLRAPLSLQTGIQHPQPGRVRQQISILSQSCGVLRVDGERPVVECAWSSVQAGIEDRDWY